MLDIRYIRENADKVQQNSTNKGYDVSVSGLLDLDNERRVLQQQVDELRQKRNENAAKMKGGKPDQALVDEGKSIKVALVEREGYLKTADDEFITLLKKIPNMAHDDVPYGATEDENVEIKKVGDIPQFDFAPKNHYEIAEALSKVRDIC